MITTMIVSFVWSFLCFSLLPFDNQDFSDPRDADDARYRLDGRDVDGSRIVVEFAKGVKYTLIHMICLLSITKHVLKKFVLSYIYTDTAWFWFWLWFS